MVQAKRTRKIITPRAGQLGVLGIKPSKGNNQNFYLVTGAEVECKNCLGRYLLQKIGAFSPKTLVLPPFSAETSATTAFEGKTVFHLNDTAFRFNATVFHLDDTVSCFYATALRFYDTAFRFNATAFHLDNTAFHFNATAIRFYATAFHLDDTVLHFYQTVFRLDNTVSRFYATAFRLNYTVLYVNATLVHFQAIAALTINPSEQKQAFLLLFLSLKTTT